MGMAKGMIKGIAKSMMEGTMSPCGHRMTNLNRRLDLEISDGGDVEDVMCSR